MTLELTHSQEAVIDDLVAILRGFLPAEEAARWFHVRHRRLDGCRPCDLILVGRGHLAVELAVHQARRATKAKRSCLCGGADVRSATGEGPGAPPGDVSSPTPTARTTSATADPSALSTPTEQHQPKKGEQP